MLPDHDGENDSSNAIKRRSVLASAGALAAGGIVGRARAGDGNQDEVVFEGLTHRSLGDATLSTDSGPLVVSDLDDEGDDGVAVETGGASTWGVSTGTTFGQMPVGGQFLTQAYDRGGNGCTDALFTRTNSRLEVRVGFRSDAQIGVEIFDSDRDDVTAAYFNRLEPLAVEGLEFEHNTHPEILALLQAQGGIYVSAVHMGGDDGNDDDDKQFGFQTSESVEFAIDGEIVEGDTVTFTELSDAGTCEYGEVRNRAVGADEFQFVSEWTNE